MEGGGGNIHLREWWSCGHTCSPKPRAAFRGHRPQLALATLPISGHGLGPCREQWLDAQEGLDS